MIKAVVFDLDGVIVDSMKFGTDSFIEVMGKEGYKVNEQFILERIGMAQKACSRIFLMTLK